MSDLKVRWRLLGEEWEPTSRERGANVYRELQRQGWDADRWDGKDQADVIVLQWDMRLLKEALQAARHVIADINDMTFAEGYPGDHRSIQAGIKQVHAIVAGSPWLEHHLKRMHPRVRMIEQPVGPQYLTVRSKLHEGFNIFWMGMHDNISYFAEIDPVLEDLAKDLEFRVHFCTSAKNGRGESNAEKVAAKAYPAMFHEWNIERCLALMAECDMGIAPLFQNAWSWCKCANKALNMMAAGLPVVVSDVPSYRAVIEDGVNGRLCFDPEDWSSALRGVIGDANLRARFVVAGRLTAAEFSVEHIAREWAAWLGEVAGAGGEA